MGRKKPGKRREKKKGSKKLTDEELRRNIQNVCRGRQPDEQTGAWIPVPRKVLED